MQKIFFQVQSTRLADPFEPLNIFLVQWAEELGRWLGNRKLVFFCENRQNHPDAKVLSWFPGTNISYPGSQDVNMKWMKFGCQE